MPTKKKAVMPKPVLAAGRRRQKGKGIADWVRKIKDGVIKSADWFRDNITKPSNLTKYIPGKAGEAITNFAKSKGYGRKGKTGGSRKGKAKTMGGGSRATGTMSF